MLAIYHPYTLEELENGDSSSAGLGGLRVLRSIVRIWDLGLRRACPPWRVLSKGSYPVFKRVQEKTTENSEWLSRSARLGFEPFTSRLPALRAELLCTLVGPLQLLINSPIDFIPQKFSTLLAVRENHPPTKNYFQGNTLLFFFRGRGRFSYAQL